MPYHFFLCPQAVFCAWPLQFISVSWASMSTWAEDMQLQERQTHFQKRRTPYNKSLAWAPQLRALATLRSLLLLCNIATGSKCVYQQGRQNFVSWQIPAPNAVGERPYLTRDRRACDPSDSTEMHRASTSFGSGDGASTHAASTGGRLGRFCSCDRQVSKSTVIIFPMRACLLLFDEFRHLNLGGSEQLFPALEHQLTSSSCRC